MYSNDTTQIEMGLTNYIGALLKASPYSDNKAQKNTVCAILLKEALELCKNKDKSIDLFSAKPILKATIFLCNQRIYEYSTALQKKLINKTICENNIKEYSIVKETLENIVSKIK